MNFGKNIMSKKEIIEKLLNSLTEEELIELVGGTGPVNEQPKPENIDNTHTIRRRGGKKKKRKQNQNVSQDRVKRNRRRNKRAKHGGGGLEGDACRKEPMNITKNRENKFTDFITTTTLSAEEREELEEAKRADAELRNKKRPQIKKRQSTLVDVVCRTCREPDSVSASLVANIKRYQCNACMARG
jgi:hypothetical protein